MTANCRDQYWSCAVQFHRIESVKAEDAVLALGALAQESRLAIYHLLVKRGPDGYSPSDLVDKVGIPAPTLSFHLKELQHAGLIASRREGRFLGSRPHQGTRGRDRSNHGRLNSMHDLLCLLLDRG